MHALHESQNSKILCVLNCTNVSLNPAMFCRFVSEVETLEASLQIESDLLNQFYKEIDDLDLWIKDTVSMFQLSSSAGNGSDVTSSSGDGGFGTGGASVAQLRGKHQVCVCVVCVCVCVCVFCMSIIAWGVD